MKSLHPWTAKALLSVAFMLPALTARADGAASTREIQKPAAQRLLPAQTSVIVRHVGTSQEDAVDPDPRIGTYVSSSWGFNTSSYWIEGPEGLILIDTQFLLSATEEFVNWAEKMTGKKAVMAIVLHANPDKFNGTGVLEKRGIKVVTSAQVRSLIPSVHEKRLKAFYDRYKPDYPKELADVLPDAFGDSDAELTAGGITVQAHVLGAGCSEAHVVVEFEGHLFVGDLVANLSHSWLEIGKIDEWLQRISEIRELKPDFIHPGRGPSGDDRLLDRQEDYLRTVLAEITAERRKPGSAGPTDQAVERVKQRLLKKYVGYSYVLFLDFGIPAVWRQQAAHNKAPLGKPAGK